MLPGILITWVGYTAVWWGWYRLGGPVDLLALIVPGRTPGPRGGTASSSPPPAAASPGGAALPPGTPSCSTIADPKARAAAAYAGTCDPSR